jgi:hypothetical protein
LQQGLETCKIEWLHKSVGCVTYVSDSNALRKPHC